MTRLRAKSTHRAQRKRRAFFKRRSFSPRGGAVDPLAGGGKAGGLFDTASVIALINQAFQRANRSRGG